MKIKTLLFGGLLAGSMLASAPATAQTKGEVVLTNAVSFLDVPYKAGTLEVNAPDEELIINCDELDCVTFVEYVAAMSKTGKDANGDLIEEEFADYVQKLRYRNGEINGYSSRLHYMTEWVENGVKAGILEDVTAANSNYRMTVKVGYMTAHPNLYPQLSASQDELNRMKAVEASLNGKEVSYIPKAQLPNEGFRWINDGDIILFTTSQDGLDVAHCGIAFNISGKLTLLHASSKEQKVTVSKVTVRSMLDENSSWSGIRVIRIK